MRTFALAFGCVNRVTPPPAKIGRFLQMIFRLL